MAKLAVVAAVFGMLVVAAMAHMTTVMVEEEDDKRWGAEESCDRQIRRARQLNHCRNFLREKSRGSSRRSSRGGSFGPGDIESTDDFWFGKCCHQLRQVEDRQCRCEALRDLVRREQGQVRGGQETTRELVETARQLPEMCGLERTCQQIRADYF